MAQDIYKVSKHKHMKEIKTSTDNYTYNIYLLDGEERKKTSLVLTLKELLGLRDYPLPPIAYANKLLKNSNMTVDENKKSGIGELFVLLPDGKEGLIVY